MLKPQELGVCKRTSQFGSTERTPGAVCMVFAPRGTNIPTARISRPSADLRTVFLGGKTSDSRSVFLREYAGWKDELGGDVLLSLRCALKSPNPRPFTGKKNDSHSRLGWDV